VSKWEKGLSVPDAEMLTRLAELLEVSVGDLLGAKIENEQKVNEVAAQLALLNEYLANRNRRRHKIWKGILIAAAAVVLFCLIFLIFVTKI
jgi:transcriptional regulator with XRE-family HTH domain